MRVLMVEDDPKIASFVVKGLKQAGHTVRHSVDGEDGLHWASTESFDAIIMDQMLPKLSGMQVITELRKQNNKTPVIILSARHSVEDRVAGLESGSDDYLTKPFAFSELLARLQALMRRAQGTTEETTLTYADLRMNLLTRDVHRGDQKIELQAREFSLLEYLLRNAERVVSKTMIMEHVWDYHFDPQTNVVEARICRLRDKVDRDLSVKLIHTMRGVGYVLRQKD